jgi:hypothetical protein
MQVDPTRLKLASYRGGIALVGPALLDAAHHFGIVDLPHHPLHVTLLTSSEYKLISKSKSEFELDTRLPDVPLHRIYILGVIRRKNVTFLVVLWNHADVWRKSLRLQKKEYHLTLCDEDDHDHINGKGISALLVSADDRDGIVEKVIGLGEDAMDNMVVGCWGDLSLVSRQFHSRSLVYVIYRRVNTSPDMYSNETYLIASSSPSPTPSKPTCGSPKSLSIPKSRC